jgi:methionine-rich copper-binding protein CopC
VNRRLQSSRASNSWTRGRAIAIGPSEVLANNRTVLVAPITLKLDPGDYTVVWYAVGEDADRVDGRYTFHLKP